MREFLGYRRNKERLDNLLTSCKTSRSITSEPTSG
jgi:hypothetical protein